MRVTLFQNLRVQIAVIAAAALSVAGLAVVFIADAVSLTEQSLTADARRQCLAASEELKRQYAERIAYGSPIQALPREARDVSLGGLSATVLRSYAGVTGGFFQDGGPLGIAGSEQVSPQDTSRIRRAESGGAVVEIEGQDALVVTAQSVGGGVVVWASKRVKGARDPVGKQRRLWLSALVISALLGVGGIVSMWYSLRSGVTQIKDGLARLEEDFGFRIEDSGGDFGEIARAVNQMAERHAHLETGLRKQDRLAALGKVVAGVAHEIRNPLNSIRLTLELLDRRLRKGMATGAEAEAAIGEIDRLDRILAQLLAFGRPTLTERRVRDLLSLVRSAVSMVQDRAQRKRIFLTVEAAEGLAADVDGPQIEQALINLLLNAIDASPAGGSVRVIAAAATSGVRISVVDQGPGIPDDARPHIFDAYFTTKPEGTGLGLSVSREIVVNHGGLLDFETGPEGTRFHLDLPAERQLSETPTVGTAGRG